MDFTAPRGLASRLTRAPCETRTSVVGAWPRSIHCQRQQLRATRICALRSETTTRNLPCKVVEAFYRVQDPALFNQTYSLALVNFVDTAILAYECGMNEASLYKELSDYKEQLEREEAPHGMQLNMEACMLGTAMVWVTLLKSPKSLRRWATLNPVTDETLAMWGGFVQMIVDGYFNKRLAWYPTDKLQLELHAVHGRPFPHQDVCEWASIVYTVLEKVHPQFPSM